MSTLQKNQGLVGLSVVLTVVCLGLYLANWMAQSPVAREFFAATTLFLVAASIAAQELRTRFAGWREDVQTRPQNRKP